jgi:hypothetical protein
MQESGPAFKNLIWSSLTVMVRRGRKNQHANVLSSFKKMCISWGSGPTVEWNETDYDVVGERAPVGRISTMSGAKILV